jgi:hypothetical protein
MTKRCPASLAKEGVGLIIISLVSLMSILWASRQEASSSNQEDVYSDMPTSNIVSTDEMKRDFVRMQFVKPADRADLGFMLPVPKNWEEQPLTAPLEELAHDDQQMVSLALLHGQEEDVQIEIAYCRVPPAIDLDQWARSYLDDNSLEIVHVQAGDFSGRQVFDTLVQAPGGSLVRMTFSRHKDKIFVVSGWAPEARYKANMRIFGIAVVSFRKLG